MMNVVDRDLFDFEEFRVQFTRPEVIKKLLDAFPEETRNYLERARMAIENEDPEDLHQAAHSLKGVVGNYLGTRAYVAATELDCEARAGDLVAASVALSNCELEVRLLGEALLKFEAGEI